MTTGERFGAERSAPRGPTAAESPYQGGGAPPFLSQPRAQSALRHELAAIAVGVESELERRRAGGSDSTFETHVLPHRLIARLGDTGLSFSWVGAPGGQSTIVAEGRLLVIEWNGVATELRGVAVLRSAHPTRERVYRPEGVDAEHWRWRVDNGDADGGEAYTTQHLVAEWLARSLSPRPV